MLPESGEEAPAVAGCRPLLFDRSTDLQQWLVQGYVESSKYFVALPRALAEWQKWESEPEKAETTNCVPTEGTGTC